MGNYARGVGVTEYLRNQAAAYAAEKSLEKRLALLEAEVKELRAEKQRREQQDVDQEE